MTDSLLKNTVVDSESNLTPNGGHVNTSILPWEKLASLRAEPLADDVVAGLLPFTELMGSRGRARKYGRPEPADRDYDRIIFTDDEAEQTKHLAALKQLGGAGYKLHDRPGGFLTASGDGQDISVYPTTKRDDIYAVWELIESGLSKDEAWDLFNAGDQTVKDAGYFDDLLA